MSENEYNLTRRIEAYDAQIQSAIKEFPRGKFYEEMVLGTVIQHKNTGHIRSEDNHVFCMITTNMQPIHTDLAAANIMGFDGVVVNGLYGLSLVVGLSVDEETTDGTLKLNLGYDKVNQTKPLQIGDVVSAETTFIGKRESKKYWPDMGVVTMKIVGYRQGVGDDTREQFLELERSGLVYTRTGFQKVIASQK